MPYRNERQCADTTPHSEHTWYETGESLPRTPSVQCKGVPDDIDYDLAVTVHGSPYSRAVIEDTLSAQRQLKERWDAVKNPDGILHPGEETHDVKGPAVEVAGAPMNAYQRTKAMKADEPLRDGRGRPLTINQMGEWVNEIGDTPCPNDGEMVNEKCWICGWDRVEALEANSPGWQRLQVAKALRDRLGASRGYDTLMADADTVLSVLRPELMGEALTQEEYLGIEVCGAVHEDSEDAEPATCTYAKGHGRIVVPDLDIESEHGNTNKGVWWDSAPEFKHEFYCTICNSTDHDALGHGGESYVIKDLDLKAVKKRVKKAKKQCRILGCIRKVGHKGAHKYAVMEVSMPLSDAVTRIVKAANEATEHSRVNQPFTLPRNLWTADMEQYAAAHQEVEDAMDKGSEEAVERMKERGRVQIDKAINFGHDFGAAEPKPFCVFCQTPVFLVDEKKDTWEHERPGMDHMARPFERPRAEAPEDIYPGLATKHTMDWIASDRDRLVAELRRRANLPADVPDKAFLVGIRHLLKSAASAIEESFDNREVNGITTVGRWERVGYVKGLRAAFEEASLQVLRDDGGYPSIPPSEFEGTYGQGAAAVMNWLNKKITEANGGDSS